MSSNEARDARDAGIQTATDHADRVCPEWKEQAYQALVAYATTHPTFTIEQLRQSLNGQLADPPSLRAWGGIAQRARRANIIEHFGWTEAEDPAVHCNVIRVWKSLIAQQRGRQFLEELARGDRPSPWGDAVVRGSEVRQLREKLAAVIAAAEPFAENVPENDESRCHRGICTARECGRCGRAYRLWVAIHGGAE